VVELQAVKLYVEKVIFYIIFILYLFIVSLRSAGFFSHKDHLLKWYFNVTCS